jgi:hypothetical protein
MANQYIGHLPTHDPLHHYLQYDILPQFGLSTHHATFRVFRKASPYIVGKYTTAILLFCRHSGYIDSP